LDYKNKWISNFEKKLNLKKAKTARGESNETHQTVKGRINPAAGY
jgi:hypothetical protein